MIPSPFWLAASATSPVPSACFLLSAMDDAIWCGPCEMWLNGPTQYEDHLIGKKHRKRLKSMKQPPSTRPRDKGNGAPPGTAASCRDAVAQYTLAVYRRALFKAGEYTPASQNGWQSSKAGEYTPALENQSGFYLMAGAAAVLEDATIAMC